MESSLGYFRDEFYYLACSRHLAWGYVDHPPLSVAALRLWTALFGESVFAIRALPLLLLGVTAWLTTRIVRTLGGGRFATMTAALCVLVAPVYLAIFGYYSMNSFDATLWTLALYLFVRILELDEAQLWPWLGLVLGLGLLNKLSVLWLGLGLAAGLVLTPARRLLLTRGPWIAATIAFVVAAPHVYWQIANGWPTAEFIRNATSQKMKATSPLAFLVAQIQNQHPFTAPVWLLGLAFALFGPRRRVRPVAIVYLSVFALLVVNAKSRAVYLAAAYPALYACGSTWIESLTARARWLRPVALCVITVGGLVTAPLVVPVLSPGKYVAHAAWLGVAPSTEENKTLGALPQFMADRYGWPELVARVSDAAATLSADERRSAAVFASNYGQAGALETLGGDRVPRVLSGHNNYWFWGPGGDADPLLVVASPEARPRLDALCASVEDRGSVGCRYCMPYESETHVYVCRGVNPPLGQLWAGLKHYD
jgi:hypothetical protein